MRKTYKIDEIFKISALDDYLLTGIDFKARKDHELGEHINGDAFEEQSNNECHYYLVKDQSNNVVFYFSLRCGCLCKPYCFEKYKVLSRLSNDFHENHKNSTTPTKLDEYAKNSFSDDYYNHEIRYFIDDIYYNDNPHINYVDKIYGGVELVHFCANYNKECEQYKEYFKPYSLGSIIFHHFVIKQAAKLSKLVGCKYLYLFAEQSENNLLAKYYKDNLHLIEHLQTGECYAYCKSTYSAGTVMLYQTIETLVNFREDFNRSYISDIRKGYFEAKN